MIGLFLAIFAVAFTFTFYGYHIIEEDTGKKSDRPVYILLTALVAWLVTIGALVAPATSTVYYPAYTVTTNTTTANVSSSSMAQYPAYSVTTDTEQPFPTWAFYIYLSFACGMALLEAVFFIMFLLNRTIETFDDALDEAGSKS